VRRRPSTTTALAFLALLVAVGGTAPAEGVVHAAARLVTGKGVKDGSLTGKDVRNSSLTGKDVKNRSLTRSDFSGSVTGPQGPQGPAGATGAQGVSGVTSVTRLTVVTSPDSDPTVDYELLRDVGTFTKSAGSRVKLTWNGRIRGTGMGEWFCDFQLRVDGVEPAGAGGRAVVFANGDPQRDVSAGATVFFDGLTAGVHQVEIWVRGNPLGPTDTCSTADGGFVDEIFVEEMPT
jgi:hypothetical protein